MDRLSILLTLVVGAITTGVPVIAVLALGFYQWEVIVPVALIGFFVLAWPASYWVSRQVKREDPDWRESAKDEVDRVIPERDAPEV
jgi:membrane protein implicated in regulation of membrane protease activity